MEPRLPTSKQWTQVPPELLQQMKSVFEEGFKAQLGNAVVALEGRIYPKELLFSLGFRRPNQLKQPNFQISLGYDAQKENVLKLIHTIFDAMGALFDEYFKTNDDSEFPRLWDQLEYEKKKLFVQYSTENTDLKKKADELLGLPPDDGLLVDDPEQTKEEIDELRAKLGITEDE